MRGTTEVKKDYSLHNDRILCTQSVHINDLAIDWPLGHRSFTFNSNKSPNWCNRRRTQHDCHHDTKVKPEAVTTVIELLMMGGQENARNMLSCKQTSG